MTQECITSKRWIFGTGLTYIKRASLKNVRVSRIYDVYKVKWFKNRLKEKYEEHVFFAEIKGRANVVFKRVS